MPMMNMAPRGTRLACGVGALAALLGGACARPQTADLRGEYVAEYTFGRERLTLLGDGTYRQEVTVFQRRSDNGAVAPASEFVVQQDRWTYDPGDGRDLGRVVLTKCLLTLDHRGHLREGFRQPVDGLCGVLVERRYIFVGDLCLNASAEYERLCAVPPSDSPSSALDPALHAEKQQPRLRSDLHRGR